MKPRQYLKQFNWRFLLVRILVNAIALAVTAAITPKIYFVDKSVWNWLLMAITLGVLNALLKPILQFLTLQFLFVTYGLVIVLVNTLILLLLSALFPARFAVDNLLWAVVGGLVLGLVSSFLESLLGLTMPIVSDEPPELREQLEEQARHADWLATARSEAASGEQALGTEPLGAEASTAEPAVAQPDANDLPASGQDERPLSQAEIEIEPAEEKVPTSEPAAEEPSVPGPDQGLPSRAEIEAEPMDSEETPPAEAAISENPEAVPEPLEGQEEERS